MNKLYSKPPQHTVVNPSPFFYDPFPCDLIKKEEDENDLAQFEYYHCVIHHR